mgnify:CR=1 FL=1
MAKKNDTFFFDNYRACADRSCKAAEFLANIMSSFNPGEIRRKLDEMHAIEQSADELRHQMSDALVKAFITPMEREDMGVLSNQLDAVTDYVEGVLHRLYFDNILEIRPDALQMVDTVVRGCKEMRALMDELKEAFLHSDHLQKHVAFLYQAGSMYRVCNELLIFHGCVPMTEGGAFVSLEVEPWEYDLLVRRTLERLNQNTSNSGGMKT